jgi:hypothetical protein
MIAFLLAQAAVTSVPDGVPLGDLPRQALPARGCAAYLWTAGDTHRFVALAGADPASLRLSIDGAVADLPRIGQEGGTTFGLAATTRYGLRDISVTLDLTIESRPGLSGGAAVPSGTLRLERPGRDGVVVPVGGLVGCAPAPAG